jgi:hypothetical protein
MTDDASNPSKPAQFLSDSAAFLVRQANLAAIPFWEGVEIRFEAQPLSGEAGVLLTAFLRGGDRRLGEREFTATELRDSARLPEHVEAWVRELRVPG